MNLVNNNFLTMLLMSFFTPFAFAQEAPIIQTPPEVNEVNVEVQAQDVKREVPTTCSYRAYAWNTKTRATTAHFTVSKPYADVTNDERDPADPRCSICSEDQVTIDPKEWGFKASPIKVCYAYADDISEAFAKLAASGSVDIDKLEGYRPGRTRGKVDADGLRTQWSMHSFGTAIDINAHRNAIYTQCSASIVDSAKDVAKCKRGIGGAYEPEKYPRLSITKDGDIYKAFTKFFKWGGEISGQTKDIMHFSITGY